MKLPSLQTIFINTKETFFRFPLVMINALLGTIIAITLVEYFPLPCQHELGLVIFTSLFLS